MSTIKINTEYYLANNEIVKEFCVWIDYYCIQMLWVIFTTHWQTGVTCNRVSRDYFIMPFGICMWIVMKEWKKHTFWTSYSTYSDKNKCYYDSYSTIKTWIDKLFLCSSTCWRNFYRTLWESEKPEPFSWFKLNSLRKKPKNSTEKKTGIFWPREDDKTKWFKLCIRIVYPQFLRNFRFVFLGKNKHSDTNMCWLKGTWMHEYFFNKKNHCQSLEF